VSLINYYAERIPNFPRTPRWLSPFIRAHFPQATRGPTGDRGPQTALQGPSWGALSRLPPSGANGVLVLLVLLCPGLAGAWGCPGHSGLQAPGVALTFQGGPSSLMGTDGRHTEGLSKSLEPPFVRGAVIWGQGPVLGTGRPAGAWPAGCEPRDVALWSTTNRLCPQSSSVRRLWDSVKQHAKP
jgi:hypothetical protein